MLPYLYPQVRSDPVGARNSALKRFSPRAHGVFVCEFIVHVSQVNSTSAHERQTHMAEADKVSQMLLVRARQCRLALEVMATIVSGSPDTMGGEGLQAMWVRHVVGKCEGEIRDMAASAEMCEKMTRAARHAQWLVQDERCFHISRPTCVCLCSYCWFHAIF